MTCYLCECDIEDGEHWTLQYIPLEADTLVEVHTYCLAVEEGEEVPN